MDQDKVNPFVGNTETPAGGTPVSATPTASVDSAVSAPDPVNPVAPADPVSSTPANPVSSAPIDPVSSAPANPVDSAPANPVGSTQAGPAIPVNPYAPAGAPYAPGSNTPAPSYADPISPVVPNTSAPDPAYTSFSPAPSQDFIPMDTPERPKLFTKKFVIFAVIGLVLIAGVVVAGLVLQGSRNGSGSGNSKNTSTSASNYNEALNIYTNYIVSGKADAAETSFSYSLDEQYFLKTILQNYITKYLAIQSAGSVSPSKSEAIQDILNAESYFNEYYNRAFKDQVSDYAAVYQSVLSIFSTIMEHQPDESKLLSSYLESDDSFLKASTTFLEKLQSLDSEAADVYIALYNRYADNVLNLYKDYSAYDCIVGGKINSSCENIPVENIEQVQASRVGLDSFFNSYAGYLFYNCQNLRTWANEGGNNE